MEATLMSLGMPMSGAGLLFGRGVIGTPMIAQGGQRLFGWIAGHGRQA